jgi:integrase
MASNKERGLKQLPDGRWQWSYKDPNGKYHRHFARTKKEAQGYLEKTRTLMREGKYLEKKKEMTTKFEDAVDKFLTWSKVNVKPSTYSGDKRISKVWSAFPGFKGKKLAAITPADVEAYKATRVKEVSQRSTDYELARLKRLFSLCEAWELCEKNPVKKVKFYHPECMRTRFLTHEEEAILIGLAPPALKPCIAFAVNTGLRLREMLLLKWKQVDLKQGLVTVLAEQAKGKRTRHVPLNEVARAALESLPRAIDPEALVFVHYGGIVFGKKKVNAHSFYRQWLDTLEAAGLGKSDVCWHTLRHTFASRLAIAGVPLPVIQKLMGHRSIMMVMRYAHFGDTDLQAAVKILNSNFQKTGEDLAPAYA